MHDGSIDIDAILAMDNRILSIEALPDFHLKLDYADGTVYTLDFRPIIAKGGVMQALRNDEVFKQVHVAHDGIAIEFPGGMDFCADSLRVDAELQLSRAADNS
ncbi:MAG: DUF2442 domain-containing protein [bacterium]